MRRMKARHGIKTTMRKQSTNFMKKLNGCVPIVENRILPHDDMKNHSVQINAKAHGGVKVESITKQGRVKSVGMDSSQIDTQNQRVAQGGVQALRVIKIEKLGEQQVYNMDVPIHHNFSVNGGLIVHNSIDTVRYALQDDMVNEDVPDVGDWSFH